MSNASTNNTGVIVSNDETHLIVLVNLLNKSISQYGIGLIWIVGNIGSTLTCLVFYQPTYRKSPCAMYFLASSFFQFLTFNFALVTRMLQYGYNVQPVNTLSWFCKTRFYLFYIFVAISRYNIILASVDRYFASSRDALRRQWSSPKIAFRVIIVNAIFWCLVYIQVLVFYRINNGSCEPQSGAYGVFFSIYISIDSGILPVLLLLIFGLLTVNNVHKTRKRIEPVTGTNEIRSTQTGKMSKKDVQLHRMLANQIFLFIILNVPNPCYLLYRVFTINAVRSPFRRTLETFLSNMSYVLVYLGFSLTFVNFIISSDIFRREFLQLIRTKLMRRAPMPATTVGVTTVRVLQANNVDG